VLLGSLVMTGIGQTLLYALLPLASRALGLSSGQSSQIFALSALLWSLSSPFWGRVADRAGGITVLVVGMLGQGLSNLGVGLAIIGALRGIVPHGAMFPALLIMRGINGVLGSAVLPSAQGMALRRSPNAPRIAIVGAVATAWTLGSMTGPGFAAVLAPWGLAVPLLVAAGLSVVSACMLGVGLRGVAAVAPVFAPRRNALRMVRRRIWGFMAMQLTVGTASAVVGQSTGFFVQDQLGLTSHQAVGVTGIALSAAAACSITAQTLAIRLRPAAWVLVLIGALAVVGAAAAVELVRLPLVLMVAVGAMGAGFGSMTLGISTSASLLTRPGQQGAVAGSLASAGSLGAIVSALAIMPFYERLPWLPYGAVGVLGIFVAAGGFLAPRPGRQW
jgi:MFS family permease